MSNHPHPFAGSGRAWVAQRAVDDVAAGVPWASKTLAKQILVFWVYFHIATLIFKIYRIMSYELRSKLCSWGIGHVQTGWSPIGYEGFEFLESSLYGMIKVSEAVPL